MPRALPITVVPRYSDDPGSDPPKFPMMTCRARRSAPSADICAGMALVLRGGDRDVEYLRNVFDVMMNGTPDLTTAYVAAAADVVGADLPSGIDRASPPDGQILPDIAE